MANEAVIIELLGNGGDPVRYTVVDSVAIEKGTILAMSDVRAAIPSTAAGGSGSAFAGIAAAEKVASDGSTTLAAYTYGIFDLAASTAITVGQYLSLAGINYVKNATAAEALFNLVGVSMETGSIGEVIAVWVGK